MDTTKKDFASRENNSKSLQIVEIFIDQEYEIPGRCVAEGIFDKFQTRFNVILCLGSQEENTSKFTFVSNCILW